MVRVPAVAGQFYPGGREELLEGLESMLPKVKNKVKAIGAVAPHAGYMYSGSVAGEVYARLMPKRTYIVLSPNHTGSGTRFASSSEQWKTPLGTVDVDGELLKAIMRQTDLVQDDPTAHLLEHSVEVQLPFIQKTAPEAKIVPLTVQHGSMKELSEVASAIVSAIRDKKADAAIISSSDMTHYESRESAGVKDRLAIKKVLDLDPEGLISTVQERNISMCGFIPTAMMLMAARELGAEKAELVKYADSGEATGDTFQVVGYAGMLVY